MALRACELMSLDITRSQAPTCCLHRLLLSLEVRVVCQHQGLQDMGREHAFRAPPVHPSGWSSERWSPCMPSAACSMCSALLRLSSRATFSGGSTFSTGHFFAFAPCPSARRPTRPGSLLPAARGWRDVRGPRTVSPDTTPRTTSSPCCPSSRAVCARSDCPWPRLARLTARDARRSLAQIAWSRSLAHSSNFRGGGADLQTRLTAGAPAQASSGGICPRRFRAAPAPAPETSDRSLGATTTTWCGRRRGRMVSCRARVPAVQCL